MTAVKEGGFYGWPYSYFGQHLDPRVSPQRPELVAKAIVPDYALGAHTASLGLAFYDGVLLPKRYFGGAFIGQHGSWNRTPRSGYKVVFIPFRGRAPLGTAGGHSHRIFERGWRGARASGGRRRRQVRRTSRRR
jgi:glucose/arabinose dehydrogenase